MHDCFKATTVPANCGKRIMLFNSFEFLFCFLPLSVVAFYTLAAVAGKRAAVAWLVLASLFFYGWWRPIYVVLLLASIGFNFSVSRLLSAIRTDPVASKLLLGFGIAANLALLGYFKYANFFADSIGGLFSSSLQLPVIVLPLAISFFTFQQIAFLVDTRRGESEEPSFLNYCLFVTFFPQLIAGPIVHHKEMLPQFSAAEPSRISAHNVAVGLTLIIIGLFKKVVIADGLAIYVDPIFSAAEAGGTITIFEAWGSALAYTMQIYFDFSGYVDMALGAARIFGIYLPLNFNSPYKARSISEFWRRWHMSLSRFLRDYLYFPLGGNRLGSMRRNINLMIVMLLGGLWHGAGWTFVFWGALHGSYLVVNHRFSTFARGRNRPVGLPCSVVSISAWLLTFVAVVYAWVFFRATTFDSAWLIVSAMSGNSILNLPALLAGRIGALESILLGQGFSFDAAFVIDVNLWVSGLPLFAMAFLVALGLPNSQELFERGRANSRIRWRPNALCASIACVLFGCGVVNLFRVSPFLYFNF